MWNYPQSLFQCIIKKGLKRQANNCHHLNIFSADLGLKKKGDLSRMSQKYVFLPSFPNEAKKFNEVDRVQPQNVGAFVLLCADVKRLNARYCLKYFHWIIRYMGLTKTRNKKYLNRNNHLANKYFITKLRLSFLCFIKWFKYFLFLGIFLTENLL